MNQERTMRVAQALAAELLADRVESVVGDESNDWQRFAVVYSGRQAVQAYLPGNYEVVGAITSGDSVATLIAGHDVAGWTLDDYVIPRFASGLYLATEVTPRADKDWERYLRWVRVGNRMYRAKP